MTEFVVQSCPAISSRSKEWTEWKEISVSRVAIPLPFVSCPQVPLLSTCHLWFPIVYPVDPLACPPFCPLSSPLLAGLTSMLTYFLVYWVRQFVCDLVSANMFSTSRTIFLLVLVFIFSTIITESQAHSKCTYNIFINLIYIKQLLFTDSSQNILCFFYLF